MFENINLALNILNEPQHRDISLNRLIILLAHIIEEHNINVFKFFLEAILYLIYTTIISLYKYTIWSLCKPFETIQDIQNIYSTIRFQIYPQNVRHSLYKLLLKTLIFDIIRAIIVFIIYFQTQKLFMWK